MNISRSALMAAIFFASTPVYASDDGRQGFILGFGAGFHVLKTTEANVFGNTRPVSEMGLATSLKIGAGITDQFALYFVQNDSWFRDYPNTLAAQQITFTIGMRGLEAAYFLAPTAPSAYFLAAKGTGYIAAPFESGNPDTGQAIMFGGGYEFEKNVTIEGTLLTTHIQSSFAPSVTIKSSTIQITLNYLYY